MRYWRNDRFVLDGRIRTYTKKAIASYSFWKGDRQNPIECASIEKLADQVVEPLFGGEDYYQAVLYRSSDAKVEGKPYLFASRDEIAVFGAASETDELLKLQRIVTKKIVERNILSS